MTSPARRARPHIAALALTAALAACSREAPPAVAVAQRDALFANGDFENDAIGAMPPSGWSLQNYLNASGVSGTVSAPPASFSALNLSGLGTAVNETYVVGGPTLAQSDPDLGPGQAFRFPAYGQRAARVNFKDATTNGKNRNVNVIRQSMTMGLADSDPVDGQIHVRFAIAPVLENPSHAFNQQPYFYVELLNQTRGTTLFTGFNVAGQTGVPWHTTTSVATGNATQWLDWQLVDISPGNAALSPGDVVQLTIVGAGCELGGHFGRIYVDGFGASIPGPYVTASAPQSVAAGAALTYTIRYANGGASQAIGAHVDIVTPPQTTFASVSGVSGCTTPAVGSTGTVSCPLGTLGAGATGSFTVTVNVSATATGSIVNGNYSIGAVANPTLLGAKVTTTVLGAATPTADIVVLKTAAVTSVQPGQAFTGSPLYTITVTNNGATEQIRRKLGKTFRLTDVVPAQLTGVTWACTATVAGGWQGNGAGNPTQCRDQGNSTSFSGSGNSISLSPRLGAGGGQVRILVYGTVSASASGMLVNTATASAPSGITDPNLANNTSTVTLPVGTPRTLTLNKGGAAYGSVTSAPAGIACGTGCATTSATFVAGAQLVLHASPVAGASFTGWSGAVPASCIVTPAPTSCTLTLSADATVAATFAAPPAPAAPAAVYVYAGDGQLASISTSFANPLAVLVTDASGTPVPNATVTFTVVPSAGGAAASVGAGTAVTSASGIARLSPTANATPGTYAVNATVGGVSSPAAFTLTNVGPPASITYVNGGTTAEPQIAPLNTPFGAPLVAVVRDAAGNAIPGATVTYTAVPAGGASATLTSGASSGPSVTAAADASGMTSVTAAANGTTGSYLVNATVAGVATPATFHLQNATTGPAAVYVVSGNPQLAPTGSAFGSLVVVVADASGNSLSGVTVTFQAQTAASGATATLSSVTAATDASGLASVTATANATGGTYLVTASVGALPPATFTLTNDAGSSIEVQAGSPQAATVGMAFASPLQALVLDGTGAAVSNATVTFQAPASGATATLSGGAACVPDAAGCRTAITDPSGVASVSATANAVSGAYAVTASTPDAPAPALFSLANQCTADSQCGGAAPICDGTTHACSACASNAACAAKDATTPYCDASGACFACLLDSQCSGTAPICNQATDACTACTTDPQCGNKDPATPYCLGTGACFPGYAIDASAGASGTISPAGAQTVAPGASLAFTLTPSTGHHVKDVLVDGASVGAVASYTFTNVQAAHTIAATFEVDTFTISASAGAHGAISPPGASTVSFGGSLAFTIVPDTGHHVADVLVDGSSAGAVASYAFSNVTADHTIAASFAPDTFAISVTAGPNGGVACPSPVAWAQAATCTVSPAPGYVLATLTDDLADVLAQVSAGSYVIANVTGPHAIAATFLKDLGTGCGGAAECASGSCADGVCCNGACGGQCEACDVAGLAGTCSPVAGAPRGGRTACASDGSTCAGACNGTNPLSCTYPGASTTCRDTSCAGGTGTLSATCTGTGSCPPIQTQVCTPYVCGATACLSSCADASQCIAGDFCGGGTCQPRKADGQGCSSADQCQNGSCVDGVCCNSACGGQCQACNLPGKAGTCSPVTGAPVGGRAACASDGSACGGACDGSDANACAYPGNVTSCRAAGCAGGTATLAASCNGAGACPAVQTQTCDPYVCGQGACLTGCSGDAECAAGHWCSSGTCVAQRANGASCAASDQCLTGNCVDGVCCDSACDGQCESCDLPGTAGTCSAVTGAPVAPRASCTSDGTICGGACDGTRRNVCTYPADAIGCRAASCDAAVATLAASCDGAGHCPAAQTQPCSPYLCGPSACLGGCSSSSECGAGNWCSGGLCVPLLANGTACAADGECANGHCIDGVCCDGACDGQCEACDVAGHAGTCSPVTGAPEGFRPACTSDGSACGGACDGQHRAVCGYPLGEVSCRAPSCAGGVATLGAACDGSGRCPALQTQPCAPHACGESACAGDCTVDQDCAADSWCSAGVCTPLVADGGACSAASQCQHGHCTDGVCCDTACGGQCEACNLPALAGTCSPVTGAPAGGRTQCASDGSACGGACDGIQTSSCGYPDGSTSCRAGSCAGGVATLGAACDGAGSCPAAQQQTCAPYLCGAGACAGNCSLDGDCASGSWCSGGVCVADLAPGQTCARDAQCGTGHCVDGVCCDQACNGQCEACDVAGHAGTCTAVSGAPHGGGRPSCASDGSACGGACDGASRSACAYAGAETTCRAASCTGAVAAGASVCAGAGACGAVPASTSCGAYACAGAVCGVTCTSSADCSGHRVCVEGACVAPEGGGSAGGDWQVTGSGGCSAAGGPSLAMLALLAFALVPLRARRTPRRDRGAGALLAIALLAPPAAARAQASTSFDVERFQPFGGAYDLLGVPSARVPGHLEAGGAAFLDFASQPLRLVQSGPGGREVSLVDSQTNLAVSATLGLLDRFELSLVLPVALQSTGDRAAIADLAFSSGAAGSGLGDLRFTPKARILEFGGWRLAAAVPVTIPSATAAYLGQEALTASPRAVVEVGAEHGWRAAGNLGAALRSRRTLLNLDQGTALTFGLAGEVPFRLAGQRFAGLATMAGEVGSGWVERPAEVLAAVRWMGPRGVNVTVGGGPGLSHGYGTPRYRAVAAVDLAPIAFRRAEPEAAAPAPLAAPAPVTVAAVPVEPPPPPPPPPEPVKTVAPPPPAPEPPPPPPEVKAVLETHQTIVEEQVVETHKIVILEQVHFATDRDVILPESFDLLQQVARILRENPQIAGVRVEGHTDAQGSAAHNLDLSRRRAGTVREFLVKEGIAAGRLESRGYGSTRPVASNDTKEGRSKNRRVVFTIGVP